MSFDTIGKVLLVIGAVIIVSGLIALALGRFGFIGRLPGDIFIQRGNITFYFPLVTFLGLSIILSIIINVIFRFFR